MTHRAARTRLMAAQGLTYFLGLDCTGLRLGNSLDRRLKKFKNLNNLILFIKFIASQFIDARGRQRLSLLIRFRIKPQQCKAFLTEQDFTIDVNLKLISRSYYPTYSLKQFYWGQPYVTVSVSYKSHSIDIFKKKFFVKY